GPPSTVGVPAPPPTIELSNASRAELQQAEQKVQDAKYNLQATMNSLLRAEASLRRCQAEREFREKRYQRIRALSDQKAVDDDTVDESLFQLQSAKAAEDLAQVDYSAAKTLSTNGAELLRKAEEQLQAVQARIEATKAQLGTSSVPGMMP